MIKVFIVDDHAVVVEGIYSLLQKQDDIEMIGYANTASNCLHFLLTQKADVVLMDISLPDMNGVDLCREVKNKYPDIMVLALSTFNQGTYIRKMMESGASGYLFKNAGSSEILTAVKLVYKGKTYLSTEAGLALKSGTELKSKFPPLTKREKEVLGHIADGLTNPQIAGKLFLSIDTIEGHRKNLHTKLNVKNTAMLIRKAIEYELL
jgi:DNA-binding NarL/FixJ family response regulator